jgi:hypothetical protein
MKVTLESTDRVVQFLIDGVPVPARLWQGATDKGIPCHAYITRIAVNDKLDSAEFDRDLTEHAAPRAELLAIPLRMIL